MDNTTFAMILLQVIVLLLLAGIVLEVIIAIYLAKIYRGVKQDRSSLSMPLITPPSSHLPEPKNSGEMQFTAPRDMDLLQGHSDMKGSIEALRDKYYLNTFTLATQDGLLVVSSAADGQEDAATYSNLFSSGEKPNVPGIYLFGIGHHGSSLVGIIKTDQKMPDAWVKNIEDDVKIILNRWL